MVTDSRHIKCKAAFAGILLVRRFFVLCDDLDLIYPFFVAFDGPKEQDYAETICRIL